ncbi:hypothetical protein DVH05_017743 [Phytophthora capsici]|nr:hypothetical protein DVH05_017743 [Phytophthora capsici]
MPVKAFASTPFKGETFPQYVLCRSRVSTAKASTQAQGPATPAPATLLTASPKVEQLPLRKTREPATPLQSPSLRPSLSEQLKRISQGAQAITTQLTTTYKLPGPSSSQFQSNQLILDKNSFQATTIGLSVGKLECRFPCPATFGSDRCTYLFQHPFEAKEVLMIMYYRDMQHASVNTTDRSFRFRLSRVLEQFGDDYNPSNTQHWIRIVLATTSEATKVKLFLTNAGVIGSRRPSKMSYNSQT